MIPQLRGPVWDESPATRCVWLALWDFADRRGKIEMTVASIARAANVSSEEATGAMERLVAIGLITRTDSGWRIAEQYADDVRRRQNAERMRVARTNRTPMHKMHTDAQNAQNAQCAKCAQMCNNVQNVQNVHKCAQAGNNDSAQAGIDGIDVHLNTGDHQARHDQENPEQDPEKETKEKQKESPPHTPLKEKQKEKKENPPFGGPPMRIADATQTEDPNTLSEWGNTPKPKNPTIEEVQAYAAIIGLTSNEASKYYDYYQALGWSAPGGRWICDYRAAMRRWKVRAETDRFAAQKTAEQKPKQNIYTLDDPLLGKMRMA